MYVLEESLSMRSFKKKLLLLLLYFLLQVFGKDEERLAKGQKEVPESLEMFSNHFLKDTPFISSNEISIADLMAECELSQLDLLADGFIQFPPKVQAWMKRCKEFLGPSYDEVYVAINKIREMMQKKA